MDRGIDGGEKCWREGGRDGQRDGRAVGWMERLLDERMDANTSGWRDGQENRIPAPESSVPLWAPVGVALRVWNPPAIAWSPSVRCNSSTLTKCLLQSLKPRRARGFWQPTDNVVSTLLNMHLFSSKTVQHLQSAASNCSGTGRNCENRFLPRMLSSLVTNAFYFYSCRIIMSSRYAAKRV